MKNSPVNLLMAFILSGKPKLAAAGRVFRSLLILIETWNKFTNATPMFGETQFKVSRSDHYRYINLISDDADYPLVFLHGMFGGLSNFDPLIRQLQGYPVFVPEIPIYELDRQSLTVPKLSEWLHSVLERHHIKNPILLGNSLGGHIALEYAISYSGHVSALVLTGSSGLLENDLGSTKPKRYDRNYIKERASLTFYEDLVDDTIIDEILNVLQSSAKLSRLLKIARATHEYNLEDQLEAIKKPVLLIWGKNDIITPPEVAETFQNKLPDATLQWIDRCGHAPMMERPEEFAKILAEFLTDHKPQIKRKNKEKHEEDYSHF